MPYAPIPFSPAETYSNRDYTLKQIELLQQQADRESAYAQQRGALMADRWQGLGGVTTETLADLVKSRDVRVAKAEAQRRYDAEQAEDRRRYNLSERRATAQEAQQAIDRKKADDRFDYSQIMGLSPNTPLSASQLDTLARVNPGAMIPLTRERNQLVARDAPPAVSTEDMFANTLQRGLTGEKRGPSAPLFGGSLKTERVTDQYGVGRRRTAAEEEQYIENQRATAAVQRAEELRKEALRYRDEQDALQRVQNKQAQANVDRQFAQSSSNQNLMRSSEDRVVREKAESLQQQIEMVLQSPSSFLNLPSATQAAIGPALQKRGFTGFGKPMSDAALTAIAQSNSAMKGLEDLRVLVFDHKDELGPLAGMASLIPYSDARKIQSDLNLSKQRVGKLLEGGVLRKEDEVKYAQILATLYDTPELALYKIDGMMRNLERDLKAFSDAQLMGGRRPMDPPPLVAAHRRTAAPPPPVPGHLGEKLDWPKE